MQDVVEIQRTCMKKAHISVGREENTPKKTNQENKTKVLPSLNFNDSYQVGPRKSSRTQQSPGRTSLVDLQSRSQSMTVHVIHIYIHRHQLRRKRKKGNVLREPELKIYPNV